MKQRKVSFCGVMGFIVLSLAIACGVGMVASAFYGFYSGNWLFVLYFAGAFFGGLVLSSVLDILDEIADHLFHIRNDRT